jgi:hypothetical protein
MTPFSGLTLDDFCRINGRSWNASFDWAFKTEMGRFTDICNFCIRTFSLLWVELDLPDIPDQVSLGPRKLSVGNERLAAQDNIGTPHALIYHLLVHTLGLIGLEGGH